MINSTYILGDDNALHLFYWAFYMVICIFATMLCMDVKPYSAIFCALCACAIQHVAFDVTQMFWYLGSRNHVLQLISYLVVYVAFYYFFVRRIYDSRNIEISRSSLFPMGTIILIVWIISVVEMAPYMNIEAASQNHFLFRLLDALCCIYVLWVQVSQKEKLMLQKDVDGIKLALSLQSEQYEMKTETIDRINQKCHDLKHQIAALKSMSAEDERDDYIKELENDIMIYDSSVNTGNKQLDIILMDKMLLCKGHEISITCMADGSRLGFMSSQDIFALFGNALDNAITASIKLQEKAKRIIDLKIISQNDIMVIQVQNYYDGILKFKDGLPQTTKYNKDEHGFGMKSMRYTAQKYNGTITASGKDGIFTLQILLPVK